MEHLVFEFERMLRGEYHCVRVQSNDPTKEAFMLMENGLIDR